MFTQMRHAIEDSPYDVVIIGGGPAGMQCAIATATEGFKTLVVEADRIGGQIKDTPILENLAGYAFGVSGPVLAANMAQQAHRLGVKMVQGRAMDIFTSYDGNIPLWVDINRAHVVGTRAVVLAVGAEYVDANIPGLDVCGDNVVFYSPERSCLTAAHGLEVVVVGGGNSAGQAVITLAQTADQVTMLTRGKLGTSYYLTARIHALPNVRVLEHADITRLSKIEGGCVVDLSRDASVFAHMVLLCTTMEPQTDWLPYTIERNDSGFIIGTPQMFGRPLWASQTGPYTTTLPGVFTIGDARMGAVRRISAAIGEGADVQPYLRRWLEHVEQKALTAVAA